jgi:hypothetical protein
VRKAKLFLVEAAQFYSNNHNGIFWQFASLAKNGLIAGAIATEKIAVASLYWIGMWRQYAHGCR